MGNGAKTRVERTRKSIVSAASDVFLRDGFLGASMDDIAATASVSKQTVYAHFQSKEELFVAVIRGMSGLAGDQLQEKVADPADDVPIERFLLDFARTQLALIMTPRLLQLRRLVIAEADRFPELGAALHERGPARSIGRLARAFEGYLRRGAMKADDVTIAASNLNWMIMGAPVNDAMFLGNRAIPPARALDAHAREVVRIFLAAYGPDRPS
ncbi:MAG: TetR/AcrR family transcriptional regulator [Rhizobiaceae bacterium]